MGRAGLLEYSRLFWKRQKHGQLSVRSILLLYCTTAAMDSGQRSVLYLHMNVKLIQMSENQELTVMMIISKF